VKLWIDLDNSPHVLFFAPLVRMLERHGVQVVITARDFSQTTELATAHGLSFFKIGEHRTPRSFLGRAGATARRAWELALSIRSERANAAISHGSRAQAMAAWLLGIPVLTLYDYEFISAGVFNRLAKRILVPECISSDRLLAQGLDTGKYRQYPGYKEEVYVYDFVPDEWILPQLGLDPARPVITVRPQANWAHYHSPRSEELFRALIERLRREQDAQVLLLPRTSQQRQELSTHYGIRGVPFRVLETAVDGLSLMFYSDAVFSGGGTMAREAALLGVNVYSFFAGKPGAADESLTNAGKLKILDTVEQIASLAISKQPARSLGRASSASRTKDFIFEQIIDFATSQGTATPIIKEASAVS
jgi:uncharacterized protein